ncbi:MAG: aminoacetone oxidase family FAD-binding enzyme [Thermoanaerobaculia bacterium]|nr:MAG: aminoacetone oxidase family FAD-binding enzyme [Thermoanaerobaculia bacterium]MBZ0102450.1 aminoacetone oxidase family FAD-binding enzyme [Thermoanaerobaculia bacterium]
MAAIQASRTAPLRIVALDGARTLGAKILVAGGGRCNVTHHEVTAADYAGSTPPAIARILRAFPLPETIDFFRQLGVELKREPTGKLFPVTDRARTVLDALLAAARSGRVELRHPCRVESIDRVDGGFRLGGAWGVLSARRVILAAGGQALPRSGSDGAGYTLARTLGHRTTATIFPALVPLLLPEGHFLRALPGVATPARLEVRAASGRRLGRWEGDLLCTHFGLSGPVVLDVSRHLLAARQQDAATKLVISLLPASTPDSLTSELAGLGRRSFGRWLAGRLPDRLAAALVRSAGLDPDATALRLPRESRRALVTALLEQEVPVAGDRGFAHAEATAGGVPLAEVKLDSLESRRCPGLHLCGELLDVDGRIGGFNFQWAWSSGAVAGRAAARLLAAR